MSAQSEQLQRVVPLSIMGTAGMERSNARLERAQVVTMPPPLDSIGDRSSLLESGTQRSTLDLLLLPVTLVVLSGAALMCLCAFLFFRFVDLFSSRSAN